MDKSLFEQMLIRAAQHKGWSHVATAYPPEHDGLVMRIEKNGVVRELAISGRNIRIAIHDVDRCIAVVQSGIEAAERG